MFKKLKNEISNLSKRQPGRRFIEFHERRKDEAEKENEAVWKKVAYVAGGLVLLLAGLLLSLPPGIPGFLLWVPALGMLLARLRILAVFLDRAELSFRYVLKVLKEFRL